MQGITCWKNLSVNTKYELKKNINNSITFEIVIKKYFLNKQAEWKQLMQPWHHLPLGASILYGIIII